MQRVNEAWGVLRDPEQRRSYDLTLPMGGPARPPRTRPASSPTPAARPPAAARRAAEPEEVPDSWFLWLARVAPVILVLGTLMVILVVTAVARDDPAPTRPAADPDVGSCVVVTGSEVLEVPCDGDEDAQVVDATGVDDICPAGTLARMGAEGATFCLDPSGGSDG